MTLEEQAAKLDQQDVIQLLIVNQKLQEKNKNQEARITDLSHQVDWFKRQIFGRKSERRLLVSSDHQLYLGELPEDNDDPPPVTETIKSYQRRQRRKASLEDSVNETGLRFTDNVPIEVIEVPNPELEGLDPSEYEIVSEKVSEHLAQRPGSYVISRYVRRVAKLKSGKLTWVLYPQV